ncbi:MAG: NAD(P)H-binding protein [Xanthomonadaceae bacterium]|jgi:putative NADH-flavin reductase|nr:NAD(P)H-binding protein [Xanthomonadaceae bacterium]
MKIALVGATGKIGRQIAQLAMARGHSVVALIREGAHIPEELRDIPRAIITLDNPRSIVPAIQKFNVLASAYGPDATSADILPEVTQTLIAAARQAHIRRLIVVGGAGSLEVAPGMQLIDTPDFPEAYKPLARAHREALKILTIASDLDWTFFAPASEIGPGEKLGHFRVQARHLLTDANGRSVIHYPDYAAAFVDEIEHPQFIRKVATAAY